MKYGFSITVNKSFEQTIEYLTSALKSEGFGILTEIDVQATFKKKLGIKYRPYTILGACNPHLAHQALESDPDIGLLLPCNVVVRQEQDASITVAFIDPGTVLGLMDETGLASLAIEVHSKLERVSNALQELVAA